MQGVLKEIGDRDEYVIFDAACGKSYLSFVMNFYLKEILKKKCHFIGVDYSETVIEASNREWLKISDTTIWSSSKPTLRSIHRL